MRTTVSRVLLGLSALLSAGPLAAQQAPKDLKATVVSPTKVSLAWTRGTNAVGHRVLRGVGSGHPTMIADLQGPAAAYIDASAPAGTRLVYQVMAKYSSGPNRYSAKVGVTTPSAGSTASSTPPPSGSTPTATQPTATPAAPSSAAAVPSSPVVAAVPLAAPTTAVLQRTPTAAPAAPPPPALPVSGRYRVVANGFSVVQQAHSHHDDVYGGFIMLHFNRQTAQLLNQDARRTKVLGDINGRVFGETDGGDFKRLRAGTASATGGLKNGDSYPDAANARVRGQHSAPPNRETFPFEIWTGQLTNASDAVIILPTLWSRDGKTQGFDNWQNAELTAASQIWWDPAVQQALRQTTLGVVAPPGSSTPNSDQQFRKLGEVVGAVFLAGLGQPWALGLVFDPSSKDRPIGLSPSANGIPRRAIVLTREMIEQALNSSRVPLNLTMVVPNYPPWILPYLDVPVGVIPVLLFDYVPPPGAPLRTAYVMYLQVERM
jgi:hypothetical protein